MVSSKKRSRSTQNMFNTFLLISFQKRKTCPKQNIAVRANIRVHFLMSILMRINRWLHLSCSPRWLHLSCSLLRCDLFQKRIDQKFPFIATNNWIVLVVQLSVKYFLLRLPRYFGKVVEKRRRRGTITKLSCSSGKHNWPNFIVSWLNQGVDKWVFV